MTSRHATSLTNGEIVEENDLGSIRRVTADSLPILSGMSIKRIVINPGAMRTPHWHADCNELTYCVSGTSLVSVLDTYSKFSSFTVGAGEMFHIDSGSLHHIENIGEDAAEFILAFRSERPEDFGLAAAFGAMTDAVLGNTYDLPASDFAKIRRDTTDRKLAARAGDPDVPFTAQFDDPHKFAVEAQSPPIGIAVGSARLARLQFWPALKDLSMYSLRIREDGMREPHWHPITAEMGYVHTGSARMTVMDPDGTLDTWHLKEGDVYFIPRAYPHHIEVSSDCPRSPFRDLLRSGDARRYRLPRVGQCLLPRSAGRDIQHAHRRPAELPVHKDRPAHRHPLQPRRRIRNGRTVDHATVSIISIEERFGYDGSATTRACHSRRTALRPTKESRMREPTMLHRLAAEFIGTCWLVFGGCGSAVFAAKFMSDGTSVGIGFLGVALAFGLTVLTGVYAFGTISGGHFNPAVTLGAALARRVEWKAVPGYWITQVIAGVGAGMVIYVIAKGQEGWTATGHMAANGFGEHSPGGYSLWAVIVAEVVLTGIFLLVILGSTDDRAPKGFAGLSIGLTLTLIHLISIPISNTSVNPARSTGVAFFNGDGAPAQLWVFWLAPLLGAAIAGIAYPYLFGRNEELADRPVRDDSLEEPATT